MALFRILLLGSVCPINNYYTEFWRGWRRGNTYQVCEAQCVDQIFHLYDQTLITMVNGT